MSGSVRTVHVVAKTHLDLGFTALAGEVVDRYVDHFFPRALAVAAELAERGGPERLVWTTGSWILHSALAMGSPEQRGALADGVTSGAITWHALPVTTHSELMDADLVRSGLGISEELDRRFDRTTTAAKMTDVPGHTRGLVPLLAEAGVTFLHLGVNPAWPVPEVPAVFRWCSPDGAELVVAYQAGGYGGEVAVPGSGDVLAFLHSGDNLGPPSTDEVIAAHAALADRYPGASVIGSTLDAFARATSASGAVGDLPVVTAEIGDPWLFGAGSDPRKVAAYRRLLRAGSRPAIDRRLLLVAEHTWGLDQKEALPDVDRWDRAGLAAIRDTPEGRRFEASWAEQRAYLEDVAGPIGVAVPRVPRGGQPLAPSELVELGAWRVAVDGAGAVVRLEQVAAGRAMAGDDQPLGLVTYQAFDEADYERFYAQLTPTPDDEWWARLDNTKPGIDAAGARSGRWPTELVEASFWPADPGHDAELVVHARFPTELTETMGAPPELWSRWSFDAAGRQVDLTIWWADKPANRLPEAMWCSFVPKVAEPGRWTLDKLGQAVSPLDVVRRGGRSLHAVGEGMTYEGPDGDLHLDTLDAPLVAPGTPNLLDADPPMPDLAGGFHVLLLDNCWGTNFPMWIEGPATFRFALRL